VEKKVYVGLGRGFFACTNGKLNCAQNGENRLSGLESVCFHLKQRVGGCTEIVGRLCRLWRIVQICGELCKIVP
jgi:hypothetical protein